MGSPPLVRLITCPACKLKKPEQAYTGKPQFNVCDSCLPEAQWSFVMQRRAAKAERLFTQILDKHDVPALSRAPKTDEFLALLMEEFGGVHEFVHEYANQLKAMISRTPGHPTAVQAMHAVGKLINENNKRADQNELEMLSREQLEEEKKREIFKQLAAMAMDRGQQKLLLKLLAPIEEAELLPIQQPENQEAASA